MTVEDAAKAKASKLLELAVRFFRKEGYAIEQKDALLEGFSGLVNRFDLIVEKGHVSRGVWIRDWNRTVGVNLIINVDKASEDVGLSSPIIVAEKFSDHAKAYANRRKITLLPRQKLLLSLR